MAILTSICKIFYYLAIVSVASIVAIAIIVLSFLGIRLKFSMEKNKIEITTNNSNLNQNN